jgi:hypothetical protein
MEGEGNRPPWRKTHIQIDVQKIVWEHNGKLSPSLFSFQNIPWRGEGGVHSKGRCVGVEFTPLPTHRVICWPSPPSINPLPAWQLFSLLFFFFFCTLRSGKLPGKVDWDIWIHSSNFPNVKEIFSIWEIIKNTPSFHPHPVCLKLTLDNKPQNPPACIGLSIHY